MAAILSKQDCRSSEIVRSALSSLLQRSPVPDLLVYRALDVHRRCRLVLPRSAQPADAAEQPLHALVVAHARVARDFEHMLQLMGEYFRPAIRIELEIDLHRQESRRRTDCG